MSCRVVGRFIEDQILDQLIKELALTASPGCA